jgi:hypothetical protein
MEVTRHGSYRHNDPAEDIYLYLFQSTSAPISSNQFPERRTQLANNVTSINPVLRSISCVGCLMSTDRWLPTLSRRPRIHVVASVDRSLSIISRITTNLRCPQPPPRPLRYRFGPSPHLPLRQQHARHARVPRSPPSSQRQASSLTATTTTTRSVVIAKVSTINAVLSPVRQPSS